MKITLLVAASVVAFSIMVAGYSFFASSLAAKTAKIEVVKVGGAEYVVATSVQGIAICPKTK